MRCPRPASSPPFSAAYVYAPIRRIGTANVCAPRVECLCSSTAHVCAFRRNRGYRSLFLARVDEPELPMSARLHGSAPQSAAPRSQRISTIGAANVCAPRIERLCPGLHASARFRMGKRGPRCLRRECSTTRTANVCADCTRLRVGANWFSGRQGVAPTDRRSREHT